MTVDELDLQPFDDAARPPRLTYFDEDGIKRDQYDRYVIPHPESGQEMSWTRVTTFAKTVSDTYTLDMWGRRMVMRGLALRADLLLMAAATPDDEKDKLNGIAKQAADAAAARAGANLGSALHAFAEQVDKGEDVIIPAPWDADIAAYRAIMRDAGLLVLPGHIEQIITEIRFKCGGKYDRIVEATKELTFTFKGGGSRTLYPGDRVIFDLKTGRNLQYGWGEIAVQLALYAHASTIWDRHTSEHKPMPELRQDVGLVLHLPAGEATGTLYGVNLDEGWKAAGLCQTVRSWRKVRNLAAPITVSELPRPISAPPAPPNTTPYVVEQPAPVVREPTWVEQIEKATSKAELSAIRRAALAQGEWTPALLAKGKKQMELLET